MGFRDPVLAGRLGGLSRSARYDGQTVTHAARSTYAESFLFGHECKVCTPISIPADLPRPERERRAAALKRAHYVRIASLPRPRRRAVTEKVPAAASASTQEVSDVHGITTTARSE